MLDLNKLYNMDCMEGMKDFPDNYFDLAIVDPPYGIGADKKNSQLKEQSKKSAALSKDYGNQKWDSNVPKLEFFNELKRISKDQIIWGVNYYPYPLNGGRICWDKEVTMPTYSDGEVAYCSKINSVKIFKYAWHGMIQGNMKNKEQRIHPTQKPVALYKWLLAAFAMPDYKIIDTHVGSASSIISFLDFGCDWIGFEIDEDYYKAASERIRIHQMQTKLF